MRGETGHVGYLSYREVPGTWLAEVEEEEDREQVGSGRVGGWGWAEGGEAGEVR